MARLKGAAVTSVPPKAKTPPPAIVTPAGPTPFAVKPRRPIFTVVCPEKVLDELGASTQMPPSFLNTLSAAVPASASVPVIIFMSALWPRRFSVLAPAPVFVTLVSVSAPLPDASMVGPPVVPTMASVRVVTSPGPTYSSVPPYVPLPKRSEPPPTLVPRLLEVAPAAPMERTINAPAVSAVLPV